MIFLPFDSRRIPPQPIGWSDHGANIPYNIRNSECRHWRNFLIERDRSRLLCHTLLHGLIFREKTCTEPMRRPASGFYKPAGFQLHEDHMGRGAAQHRIQIETANTRESTRIAVARTLTAFAAVSAATEEQARNLRTRPGRRPRPILPAKLMKHAFLRPYSLFVYYINTGTVPIYSVHRPMDYTKALFPTNTGSLPFI